MRATSLELVGNCGPSTTQRAREILKGNRAAEARPGSRASLCAIYRLFAPAAVRDPLVENQVHLSSVRIPARQTRRVGAQMMPFGPGDARDGGGEWEVHGLDELAPPRRTSDGVGWFTKGRLTCTSVLARLL
jgi:hypothetical protein